MLGKIPAYRREFGWKGLCRRLRRAVYHQDRYVIYTKSLTGPDAPGEYEDVRFRVGTVEDVPWLARNWPPNLVYVGSDVEGVLRARFAGGEVAVLGVSPQDERPLLYMSWLSRRDHTLLAFFDWHVPEGDWCSKNLVVAESHRGRGIGRRGQQFAETVARDHGARRIWAFVQPGNVASRRLHERLGYAMHGTIGLCELFGRPYAKIKEGGKVRTVSLGRRSGHLL